MPSVVATDKQLNAQFNIYGVPSELTNRAWCRAGIDLAISAPGSAPACHLMNN